MKRQAILKRNSFYVFSDSPITITYSMEQYLSWQANRFSENQEIPHISRNAKIYYRIHKCPTSVPILSQFGPIHTSTSHFLKIHLNTIPPSTPGSSKWSLSLRFLHQTLVYASSLPRMSYMLRPSHSSLFDHPKNIGWKVQIIKLLIR
jgi:hypothetical protein